MHFGKKLYFYEFQNNKKVTKSHFRVLAYVYDVFCCSERSESQSCVLSAFEHFGAPKSPKSHFFIRVRRFFPKWRILCPKVDVVNLQKSWPTPPKWDRGKNPPELFGRPSHKRVGGFFPRLWVFSPGKKSTFTFAEIPAKTLT